MRNSTLLFLIKGSEGKAEICLAMKKRSFGAGRWNGVGGKVAAGETIEDAARREAFEEIGITARELSKVAELSFSFPHNPAWDQLVHVFLAREWDGESIESEEMAPKWFPVSEIPYKEMWPDDIYWLPKVLERELIRARFVFGEGDVIKEKEVSVVRSF